MGRPIQKKFFGDPASVGSQLKITAKLPGESVAEGFIVEQTGTRKYKVNIGGTIGDVYLVNKSVAGNLEDGEAFILATPFGGSALPVYKITQYRVSVHDGAGGFKSYEWSADAATNADEADVIDDASVSFETATATTSLGTNVDVDDDTIISITVDTTNAEYLQVPTVTITGDGTGATATATISGGVVTAITVDTAGSGYTTAPTVTVQSPEDANA